MDTSDEDIHTIDVSLQESEDVELDLMGDDEYSIEEPTNDINVDNDEMSGEPNYAVIENQPFTGEFNDESLEFRVRSGQYV